MKPKSLFLALCLIPGVGSAADWYLAPTSGSDQGDGSQSRPFRSISRLLDPATTRVASGDRLILRGGPTEGAFRETEIRLRMRLTISAFPGETPKIECPINIPDTVCIQIDPEASGSRLSGLDISGGNLYGVFLQTDWDIQSSPSGRGASDVIIEDSKIHDTGRDAIKVTPKSENLLVRRCEIYRSGMIYPPGTPLEDRNAEGIDNVQGHRMQVQDSYVHDTSTNGIYFKGGAADVIIERNRVERAGEAGILVGFDTSPDFFDTRQNPSYYEAVRGIVRNNVIRDTAYSGIGLYASQNAIVANNTLVDTAKVGHAALYFGVTLQDFEPQAGRPANVGPTIVNNLIIQQSSPGRCGEIRFANELGGLSGLSGAAGLNNNLYSAGSGCRFVDQRNSGPLTEGGTLAQWKQLLATDVNSFEAPAEVTATGRIASGSPAIDRGQTIAAVTDDIDRSLRTVPFDIGADELGGGSNEPPPTNIPITGALSGAWVNFGRNGEGFMLEVGANQTTRNFLATWYTYRSGQQEWLIGNATLLPGARSVTLNLMRTRGAQFGAAFRQQDVVLEQWGTAEFTFSSCYQLTVRYSVQGESGTLNLTRLVSQLDGVTCNAN